MYATIGTIIIGWGVGEAHDIPPTARTPDGPQDAHRGDVRVHGNLAALERHVDPTHQSTSVGVHPWLGELGRTAR